MKSIRNAVKAVIIKNHSILLIKKTSEAGPYYIFPGGGQDKYEDMHSALRRECREETGADVLVEHLMFMREYIGKNHEFADSDSDIHQVEFYFSCRLADGAAATGGAQPDVGQIAVEWVPVANLNQVNVYPKALRSEFVSPSRTYFGDIN